MHLTACLNQNFLVVFRQPGGFVSLQLRFSLQKASSPLGLKGGQRMTYTLLSPSGSVMRVRSNIAPCHSTSTSIKSAEALSPHYRVS